MSINAVSGVSQSSQPADQPAPIKPAAAVSPFGQQLDAQSGQADAAQGHHQHHHKGGTSQSVTSSAASAASVAGVAASKSVAPSLLNLLS
jgi:hypothetical protein